MNGSASSSIAAAVDDDTRWTLALPGGVSVTATSRPDSPILSAFFSGYDRAFVLPDEKEDLDGFRACLALNPVCHNRFGRTNVELVAVARDADSGTMLGGINFLATGMHAVAGHPTVSVALNYLFVEAAARGRGLSRILLNAVAQLANCAVGQPGEDAWPAIFIEQNDPLLMTPEAYALDSAMSGIDQLDRLKIWYSLGASLVDFPYVQPALAAGRQPDRTLAYAAVQFPGTEISPAFLRGHLESFFGISVLKGGDPQEDEVAMHQLVTLDDRISRKEAIPLIAMGRALEALADRANWLKNTPLRDFTRSQRV